MFPSDDYLADLKKIISEHSHVPCTAHMQRILENAKAKKLTTLVLNTALGHALHDEKTLMTKLKHAVSKKSKEKADQEKAALREALETVIGGVTLFVKPPSPRSPRVTPDTPDKFSRALYHAQLSLWYTDEKTEMNRKINNSIERLKNVFVKHENALKNMRLEAHVKSFHLRRMHIISNWIEQDKIGDLTQLIKSIHSETRKTDLHLSYQPTDAAQQIQFKQEQLHWLGIILEDPAASESPYAMSEILDLLQLPEDELKEGATLFSKIYVVEDASAWINIDSEERNNFFLQLEQGEDYELRAALIGIYNSLHVLIQGADQISSELRKLEDELDLAHPSNRSNRESSKTSLTTGDMGSYKDSVSSTSMMLSTPSRLSSRITSAGSSPLISAASSPFISETPSPNLTDATPVENSGSSKTRLTQ